MGTTSKTKTKKETIKGRQIGRNIIITIGRKKYSRAFPKKEEREAILELVEKFNTRNSKAKKAEIIKLMTAAKEATKAKKATVKEKVKKAKKPKAAPKVKKATATEIAAAAKLLRENEYRVEKISKTRRSGEH